MIVSVEKTREIVQQFGKNEADTGTTEVQCALLTNRILGLTQYVKARHKDVAAKRALLKLAAQRKRLLAYLASKSTSRYRSLVASLNLRESAKLLRM
jgi:small subunit ribosomal protein S15